MGTNTDGLQTVSEERVPLPPGFEIAQHVRGAAAMWPLQRIERVDMVCGYRAGLGGRSCGQVIVPVRMDEGLYEYSDEEYEGLVLAHLMQCHGWTRETIGER